MSSLDPALFEPDRSEPTDHVAARPPLAFWSDVWRRFRQNVFTRYTLRHPLAIPLKATAELRGYLLARRLRRESFPRA